MICKSPAKHICRVYKRFHQAFARSQQITRAATCHRPVDAGAHRLIRATCIPISCATSLARQMGAGPTNDIIRPEGITDLGQLVQAGAPQENGRRG